MRRRLIIHMGMAKSGSTAIQTALLRHEAALKDINILNPTTGRRRGAHWGILEEIRDSQEPFMFTHLNEESSNFPTTVISCEAFFLLTDDGIERLVEATKEWDVNVILYLRRPGEFLASSYRQHIKSGKISGTAEEFVAAVRSRLAYDHLVSRWSRFFPLTVRIYDLVRNQIEEDFLTLIGAGHLKPERRVANGTPPDGATKLMRLANKCVSKRSRRFRINRTILSMQNYLSWIPPIDNTPFQHAGHQAASDWNREMLLQFLSPSDLEKLVSA